MSDEVATQDQVEKRTVGQRVEQITCAESDKLREGLTVVSSCTDMDASFHSEPQIDTVWGTLKGEEILRDIRYPAWEWSENRQDRKPYEHFRLE